ncbi:CPBP family intramembrane glutamic endopeptidase [Roseiterribacter gracilis]|uniref:CAAX amino protease n=1 Tax=Roseiterribacter gracilis TaxID=2812848 RepID=A0A8S8XHD5_9PROT|nr:CAAX amino protease [Rhodospirillales bacterium TMPK1]
MRRVSLALFATGYVLAFAAGDLDVRALGAIALLVAAGWAVRPAHAQPLRIAGHVLFILLTIGCMQHLLPGFFNTRVFGPAPVTPDGLPYSLWLNLDKPLIGIWVMCAIPWVEEHKPVWTWLRTGLIACAAVALTCLVLAWGASFVTWEPKVPSIWLLWCLDNLLLVTFAEEALFRGYAQSGLTRVLGGTEIGDWLALVLATLLFGMAHAGGGAAYMLFATIAGAGYGIAYRSGGLQAARLAHFGVNALHFFLFTYPMLATARD